MEHCEAPLSMTLLQVTWSGLRPGQDPSVLSTLMSLRADPDLVARSGIGAMWLALDPGQVQVLLEHKAILEHSALMLSFKLSPGLFSRYGILQVMAILTVYSVCLFNRKSMIRHAGLQGTQF